VQGAAAAACETVNVCPPIVSVALRVVVLGFAATLNWTEPLPVPVAVTVTHAGAPVAVHTHEDAEAVTVTAPDPPVAAND
jgi:hypothetical protein